MPWPITPHLITPRVCRDLGWSVSVHCPGCRYTTSLHGRLLDLGRHSATPLPDLLAAGAFRCRRRCEGERASRLDVSMIDVGQSRQIASWSVYDHGGGRGVTLDEP